MKRGWVNSRQLLFISSILILLIGSGCVRPTPRPENVQITEVPNLTPAPVFTATPFIVPTATPDAETINESATATAEADAGTGSIDWPQSHTVIAGDTISRISIIYGVDAEEIIAANSLANPNALEIGQVLTIPEPGSVDLSSPATPEPATDNEEATAVPAPTEEQVYIVQAGDTLFRIALNFNTTIEALADYNNITNINALELGQEIRIPPAE